MKWVIITDVANGEPVFVLDAHHFLRDALFDELDQDQNSYWHRPIVIRDMKARLGDVIGRMKVVQENPDDDLIENDLILFGSAEADYHRLRPAWPPAARDRDRGARSRRACTQLGRRGQQPGRRRQFTQVLAGQAITVPNHLVAEIDKGTEDETGSRQPDRGHEIADHHVVGGEVHDRRDGAIGDRLG